MMSATERALLKPVALMLGAVGGVVSLLSRDAMPSTMVFKLCSAAVNCELFTEP